MTVSQNNGLFFWRDHRSSDPEKAKAFYTALFGWNINSMPMGDFSYDMIDVDSVPFGGITPLSPDEVGVPAHWGVYLGTPDVDALVAKVAGNGGEVKMPPMDIPTVGRFAVITDPTGAYIMPMTILQPFDIDLTAPVALGTVTWNELYTSDVDAAVKFYTTLFDLDVMATPMMPGFENYTMLTAGGAPVAGVFPRPEGMPVSAWGTYFRVADIDAAIVKIGELGGQVLMPPMEVPETGKIAAAMDTTGAIFNVHQTLY
ncbi:MAG: VOC family protein [Thermomicrobiales bacterium]